MMATGRMLADDFVGATHAGFTRMQEEADAEWEAAAGASSAAGAGTGSGSAHGLSPSRGEMDRPKKREAALALTPFLTLASTLRC